MMETFHRARRGEGREAWPAPRIMDWQRFVRSLWEERATDFRLPLNSVQERSLWEEIVGQSGHSATILEGPRRNLADMAMQAHALLCSYAPQFLNAKARGAWDQDAKALSRWLTSFDEVCRQKEVVSPNRLALETIPLLTSQREARTPLLLAGFDRVLPVQQELFDAWGEWNHIGPDQFAVSVQSFAAGDEATELSACAAWCSQRIRTEPDSRILVIAQDVHERRGEFERAFLREAAANASFQFELSLGVPLAETGLVRSASLLLRWLNGELAEHEVDWLVSSPYAGSEQECASLPAAMRAFRNRGMQRPQWSLRTFLNQRATSFALPSSWVQRMTAAQSRLQSFGRELAPTEWAQYVPLLLDTIGWLGEAGLTSAEYQVRERWNQALETCGSLGFDGRRISWQAFLSELLSIAGETLFAPESENAPVLIAGAAESAGLSADAVWFLGADEDAWPGRGDLHPLLPPDVQRRAQMPHSSPQLDWDLTQAMTARVLASAREVRFSFARQRESVETRPSRLIAAVAGDPQPLPASLLRGADRPVLAQYVDDASAVPLRAPSAAAFGDPIHLRGGASLLTAQSQCPFKAFAIGRLGARTWDRAAAGLTAAERGQLLHAVLHSVWAGPPSGIRTTDQLRQLADLESFVAQHVIDVIAAKAPARTRDDMPARYLEIEALRLTRLITAWLTYERTRVDFEVVGTEMAETISIAGLSLDLRLDRLDRLNDGSVLVLDYKTGDVTPKSWDLPRPEDVQLPLYAGFGLDEDQVLGGLVFAKVRAGDMCFAGRVGNACGTLDVSLGRSSLAKNPLTAEQLIEWREAIEQLARDFLGGRADVDPRDVPKTCTRCGLYTICRIQERETLNEDADAEVSHD